jgi:hypothetical protein
VNALIDSGADTCLIPASMAEDLGIVIPNERQSRFYGTSGVSQAAYFDDVEFTLWNGDISQPAIRFDAYVGFCSSMEHVGMIILGQDGFFSQMRVGLDLRNNAIDIYPVGTLLHY